MVRCDNYAEKYPQWYDWKWQFSHRITNVEQLSKILTLDDKQKDDIASCLKQFRMAITPYYASLIKSDDINDPVRRQCVPSIEELKFCEKRS